MTDNNSFIQTVKIDEIPWHRLTTAYGRATDFPKYLRILSEIKDIKAIEEAGELLAINISHQSTLWHSTPFALIFLVRIFKDALIKRQSNSIADYLVRELLELFVEIAEAVNYGNMLEHAEPLPHFSDLLKEEYLWSEVYDEEADELRYEDDNVFPDDLFYSFYYYSKEVLLTCKPLLIGLEYEDAGVLCGLL
jgi:hypothetical protein